MEPEPGESGRDRAARAARDAEGLEAQARGLLQRAEQARQAAERFSRGNEGEQVIGSLLEQLAPQGWKVLHDRRRQPRSPANLDHVLVGPAGVFVIDAKNWTGGRLRLDDQGMAVGRWRKDDALHSAKVDADIVREHVDALGERAETAAVLAFVHDIGLSAPVQHREVVLIQREQLLPWLMGLPARLTADQVAYLAAALSVRFPPRLVSQPPQAHASTSVLPAGGGVRRRGPAPAAPTTAWAPAPALPRTAAQRRKDRAREKARRELKTILVKLAVVAAVLPFAPWFMSHIIAAATPTIVSHLVPIVRPVAPVPSVAPRSTARRS